jgi:dTDP-4-dehydrorhamnose reductase
LDIKKGITLDSRTRVLVLGASGMLGNAMVRRLSMEFGLDVWGTVRSSGSKSFLLPELQAKIVDGIDVENQDDLMSLFSSVRPQVVINCVGLIKQLKDASDPLNAIPINSLLPHRLARLCDLIGARFIHFSTDCVFSGSKGGYKECDPSDAEDVYGRTKFLGEVDYAHAITLRTSIIGHELQGSTSLVGWFLAQQGQVKGFEQAIFSGLPTVELAQVVSDFVLPRPDMHGVYHVSSDPINKYELLRLIAEAYGKSISIVPDQSVVIDRSLDSSRFKEATGYQPPSWRELVAKMQAFG